MKKENDKTISELCEIISNAELTPLDIVEVISGLLFSIGASLENCNSLSGEEISLRYLSDPTLGNALMAQSMHMITAWNTEKGEEE